MLFTRHGLRGENRQQQKNEMHFTIIQAESCDKVKIIIIFNNILFFIFMPFSWRSALFGAGEKQCGWLGVSPQLTNVFRLIKISWNVGET